MRTCPRSTTTTTTSRRVSAFAQLLGCLRPTLARRSQCLCASSLGAAADETLLLTLLRRVTCAAGSLVLPTDTLVVLLTCCGNKALLRRDSCWGRRVATGAGGCGDGGKPSQLDDLPLLFAEKQSCQCVCVACCSSVLGFEAAPTARRLQSWRRGSGGHLLQRRRQRQPPLPTCSPRTNARARTHFRPTGGGGQTRRVGFSRAARQWRPVAALMMLVRSRRADIWPPPRRRCQGKRVRSARTSCARRRP